MKEIIKKASVLIEALPYIKNFYGKKVVIKFGGSALKFEDVKNSVIEDIVLMKYVGISPIIVHGGGPEINKMLEKLQIKPKFINGFRVTDERTMEIVEMVLSGSTNKDLVSRFQKHGVNAVGISGKDANTLISEQTKMEGHENSLVGEVIEVNTKLLDSLIDNNFVPVIAPIGITKDGKSLNINADYAAVSVATAIKAEKLVFMTDVKGIMKDIDDESTLYNKLSLSEAQSLIENKIVSGGMIPKIQCCMSAIKKGISRVHILDGMVEHSLLLEIFTDEGIGTMFYQ